MQGLNHRNLVNFVEILPEAEYFKKNGNSYKVFYILYIFKCMAIVIELAVGGELFEYVA